MEIEFDSAKNAINIDKHGVSFDEFVGFDAVADVVIDDRIDYGEVRFQARGRINGKGFCLVFTETPNGIRIISLRRAKEKEMRRYE